VEAEGSGSFLKKRTKKLFSVGAPATAGVLGASRAKHPGKVFWFFFSKKHRFP
jgi:hypothetical protein